jgi:hypothetical protein
MSHEHSPFHCCRSFAQTTPVASGSGPDFSDAEQAYKDEIKMARKRKIILPASTYSSSSIRPPLPLYLGERQGLSTSCKQCCDIHLLAYLLGDVVFVQHPFESARKWLIPGLICGLPPRLDVQGGPPA